MKLIDKGDFYEIEDYEPIVDYHPDGHLRSVIYCPYIPKNLFKSENHEN